MDASGFADSAYERICVYFDEAFEAYCAYCVDADYLVGFGDTEDEALGDLDGMLAMHERLIESGQIWRRER